MKSGIGLAQSLGLSEKELRELLAFPDSGQPDETSSRRYSRRPYYLSEGLVIERAEADVAAGGTRVAPRDISAGGIGLLHRGWLPGGTEVALYLPMSPDQLHVVRGQVVRCFGLTGEVYDVGVSFHANIDVESVLRHAQAAKPPSGND